MGANPSDEVRIDVVPFLRSSGGAKPRSSCTRGTMTLLRFISCCAFILSYVYISHYYPWTKYLPRFQLDYVSISSDNTTVVWDIGYSINASVGDHLQVWARFMSRDFKAEALGRAGNNSSVSISTLLPRGSTHDHAFPLTLERVVFKSYNYRDGVHDQSILMAACEDVCLWNNETSKTTQGPRLCPIVYNKPINYQKY